LPFPAGPAPSQRPHNRIPHGDGFIRIRGARTHNLKNLDLDLPRDKLIVITGLSGSGKSSLAFDTIYAEGQRRYVESLSAYAPVPGVMEKPDLDHIEGLSPAISIEQKSTSHNPRSTVGTITEIYDYLRLLYARVGTRAARTTAIRWKRRRSARWSTRCWPGPGTALPAGAGHPRPQGRACRNCSTSCTHRASCACAWTAAA
jgi:excinuclease ABC subunit A